MHGRKDGCQEITQDLFNRPLQSRCSLLGLFHGSFRQSECDGRHRSFHLAMILLPNEGRGRLYPFTPDTSRQTTHASDYPKFQAPVTRRLVPET